jgi:hypothetical protein
VQGFQTPLPKKVFSATAATTKNKLKNSPSALNIASINVKDIPSSTDPSTPLYPFAFCHGSSSNVTTRLLRSSQSETMHHSTEPFSNFLAYSSKIFIFNLKRAMLAFVWKGHFLLRAIKAKNQKLPASLSNAKLESKLSAKAKECIETLFDIICESDSLAFMKLPNYKMNGEDELSIGFKLTYVSRFLSERFDLLILRNSVPPDHSKYDQDHRDFVNTFLMRALGVTYEQIITDLPSVFRVCQDQEKRLHHFQGIALSTLVNDYIEKPVKNQRYLSLVHEKMGVSPTIFRTLHKVQHSIMMEIVRKNRNHMPESEKTALVEYFMKHFSNHVTRAGVIHDSYQ